MKRTIILIVFICSIFLKGEDQPFNLKLEKNSLDFNYILTPIPLGGNITYNRVIYTDLDYFLEANLGFEAIFFVGWLAIPHGITLNYGSSGSHYLLLGLNGRYVVDGSEIEEGGSIETYNGYFPPISPLVGWKYVVNNRFSFKLWGNMILDPKFSVLGAIFYAGLNYRF